MHATEEMLAAPVRHRLRWWKEALIIAAFYVVYSVIRDLFGSARLAKGAQPVTAFDNALRVIRLEKFLGLYHEQAVQQWFLKWHGFIKFWNIYYATLHFVVTVGAFVWLYVRQPERFPRWRNTLAFTTALALVGFSLFPLMPPRLLEDSTSRYGGATLAAERGLPEVQGDLGFTDTMRTVGGLWNFDSGGMNAISNQYAAMPSLHIGWSTWSAFVMWPLVRRRWARGLLVLYPLATLFCIVVTANHYWLDGIGGLTVLTVGYLLGSRLDHWVRRRRHVNPDAPGPRHEAVTP